MKNGRFLSSRNKDGKRAVFKYLRNCHLQENLDSFTVDMWYN